MDIRCDFNATCQVINQLREIAENVRTWGGSLDGVATGLHMQAAGLESIVRGYAHAERKSAQLFGFDTEGGVVELPDLLPPPATVVAPQTTSREISVAEVSGAANRLRAIVTTDLPAALDSPSARTVADNLLDIISEMDRYVERGGR